MKHEWKKEISETSNGVWKVSLQHSLGSIAESTGFNLQETEKEVEKMAKELEKQIEDKIRNSG